jgi:hypothetical protein
MPPDALVCFALVPFDLGALRRGFGPAADLLSCLCKTVGKEHTPTSSSPVVTGDALRCSGFGVGVPTPSAAVGRCGQTEATQSVHEARCARTPKPCAPRRGQRGPRGASFREGQRTRCVLAELAPSKGSSADFTAPRSAPARRGHAVPVVLHETGPRWGPVGLAEEHRTLGRARSALRDLTGGRVSERRLRSNRSEFDPRPKVRAPQGTGRDDGRRGRRGVLSLPSFFAQAKKEGRHAGANSRRSAPSRTGQRQDEKREQA